MLAVYWIILSPLIDQSIDIHNSLASSDIVSTQERSDAVNILHVSYNAFPIFALIVLVIWLLLQSLREREGGVF